MEIKLENLISHEESTKELDFILEMGVKIKERMPNKQIGARCGKHYELFEVLSGK